MGYLATSDPPDSFYWIEFGRIRWQIDKFQTLPIGFEEFFELFGSVPSGIVQNGVYIDAKHTKSIVAIRPKPPFKPVFQVAATKEGAEIHIINEPIKGTSVFLVETGESPSIPETTTFSFIAMGKTS